MFEILSLIIMQIKQKKENDTHTHTSILGVAKVLQHFLFHLYLG